MAFKASLSQRTMFDDLREYQEQSGLSLREVEKRAGWANGKLSKTLRGLQSITLEDLRTLMEIYDVPTRDRQRLQGLRDQSRVRKMWWDAHEDWLPREMQRFIEAENVAVDILCSHALVFPGLVQSAEYMRWDFTVNNDASLQGTMLDWVDVRQTRQEILTKPKPPRLEVIFNEGALYYGPETVLIPQIEHMLQLMKRPRVRVGVVPKEDMTLSWSFDLLKLPNDRELAASDYAFVGRVIYDDSSELRRVGQMMDNYRKHALDAEASAQLITKRLTDLKGTS